MGVLYDIDICGVWFVFHVMLADLAGLGIGADTQHIFSLKIQFETWSGNKCKIMKV
jgi:hypothetical protein